MPMTQGICFYVDYPTHAILCSVAIHSLLKHYDGAVHVIYGEHCPKAFLWGLSKDGRVTHAPAQREVMQAARGTPIGRVRECWYRKPYLHLESPFDVTLMYDCDHVFINKFDLNAFKCIEEFGLVSFHHRPCSVKSYKSKARRVRRVMRDRGYTFHYPANGGCVGSVKDRGVVEMWCRNMEKILQHEGRAADSMAKVADEYALAYTLGRWGGIMDGRWSCGIDRVDTATIGIHFARKSYMGDHMFLAALKEALAAKAIGLHKLKPPALIQYASWARAKYVKRYRRLREHQKNR